MSISTYSYLLDGNIQLSTHNVACSSNNEKFIECYVDADFTVGWVQPDADNSETVMSHIGCVITYSGCPVLWCSKSQTEISLSKTEEDYIALIQAMHNVINFMSPMKEISFIFGINNPNPEVFCKVLGDNQSCIDVAE